MHFEYLINLLTKNPKLRIKRKTVNILGGREEYSDWFHNDNPYDQILGSLYNGNESFWPTEENLQEVAMGTRVILTNRVFILSKSIHGVYPLPFNVFANPLEMISERGFPLLKRFSNLIMFMRDAGIIQKLYDDFYYNVTVLYHIRDRDGFEETQIVLTLNHMDGAFTLFLLGQLISSMAFVVELIVGTYHRRRRRARRMWRILQNSWHQVSILRSIQKIRPRNVTEVKSKWNTAQKCHRKVRFNTSNNAFKSNKWRNAFENGTKTDL